jgi:hypothetical protein
MIKNFTLVSTWGIGISSNYWLYLPQKGISWTSPSNSPRSMNAMDGHLSNGPTLNLLMVGIYLY